ncbi:MAG TPA: DMT family transporter [Jatrophihabitans sp.]
MFTAVVLSVVGALAIGAGWILQHRATDELSARRESARRPGLMTLIREPVWWAGIAAMSIGQTASGVALQRGALTLVAPLLSTNLLCAFLLQSAITRHWPPRRDLLGAAGVAVAVIAFVLIGGPHVTRGQQPTGLVTSVTGTAVVAAVALVLLLAGIRRGVAVTSISAALAAGLLYGLQDVATRAGFVLLDRHDVATALTTVWPYLLLGAAIAAVLATQWAMRAVRLDYVLPPMATTQPIVGVILGVVLLGDSLDVDVPALAVEAVCLTLLIVSAAVLSRSAALGMSTSGRHAASASPLASVR